MKRIITFTIVFISHFSFGQLTPQEIDKIALTIDSLYDSGSLLSVEYDGLSWCGGSVSGYFFDSSLVFIKSQYSAEAGHISQDIYVAENNPMKIIYKNHTALWDEHTKNYPEEAASGDYIHLTYADTTRTIYFLEEPLIIKESEPDFKIVVVDFNFYSKLLEWFKCMREQVFESDQMKTK